MNELNQEQRRAVEAAHGPVLITAGPGTGKTKTLIARIQHLIKQGMPADRILALTFTNKAAREMQARLPTSKPAPRITTFHALCHQFLTELRGEPPALVSNTERQQLIRNLKKSQIFKSMSVRELELHISRLKNQPADFPSDAFLEAYQNALADRGVCDFDDLLRDFYGLLSDEKQRKNIQRTYEAILVDEFQDTNALQYELLKLLNSTDNLFVIGDPLQSIYGFRGANADVFEQFKRDWPATLSITLQTNYRSAPEIVTIGCEVFPDAPRLSAHRQETGQVQCVQVLNEYSEASWIINTIERRIGGSTMLRSSDHHTARQEAQNFRDFAVLYRTHRTAKTLRRLLDESGIPYQVAGEGSPYLNPAVTALTAKLKKHGSTAGQTVSQLIAQKAKGLGFDETSPDIRMLINNAVRFDNDGLPSYLEHLDTIAEQEFYDPGADAVTLLTVHAAKGLEFDHVFLIGTEDGLLPLQRPKQQSDHNEERRLFYVAVTRARNHLHILHTKKRAGEASTLSPFVTELKQNILPRHIDPDMAAQQERLRKKALKRSQTTLF